MYSGGVARCHSVATFFAVLNSRSGGVDREALRTLIVEELRQVHESQLGAATQQTDEPRWVRAGPVEARKLTAAVEANVLAHPPPLRTPGSIGMIGIQPTYREERWDFPLQPSADPEGPL